MTKETILKALASLDRRLKDPTRLIIGGGAALIAGYGLPLDTEDVDGVPDRSSMDLASFRGHVRAVGRELKIAQNWLNDYFGTFLFVLPPDYGSRLITIFKGTNLEACALGKEDLILMKCFAGRDKDLPHVRTLIRKGPDLKLVDQRLQELLEKKLPGAQKAADFFDDVLGEMGITP